jgi:prepilin-type N-terminal cleavage/methylation domain-containing protein
VKTKFQISNCEFRIGERRRAALFPFDFRRSVFVIGRAFTLIEVMVVMVLLSLIVIALMTVFNSTQAAFRASVTQTDVLESGRAAMDLITDDLRAMTPTLGISNQVVYVPGYDGPGPVNFFAGTNAYQNPPLIQPLIASSDSRTNVQQDVFMLSRGNLNGVPTWSGTGYAVFLSTNNTYSLYRFSTNHPVAQTVAASNLFWVDFQNFIASPTNGGYSHLLDGVVNFQVRTFDASGGLILTNRMNIYTNVVGHSATPSQIFYTANSVYFFSNALPASVEIEMATIEDRSLQRAESLPFFVARSNYLAQQAGKVHVFRQRVAIPNVDPSVYQ